MGALSTLLTLGSALSQGASAIGDSLSMTPSVKLPFVYLYYNNIEIALLDRVGDPNLLDNASPIKLFLIQMTLNQNNLFGVGGGASVQLVILDPTYETLLDMLFAQGGVSGGKADGPLGVPGFGVKFGWVGEDDILMSKPPYPFTLDSVLTEVKPGVGTIITLNGTTQAWSLFSNPVLGTSGDMPYFTLNTPISTALESIIRTCSPTPGALEPDVEPDLGVISSETNLACGRTAIDWIEAILKEAQDKNGQKDIVCWVTPSLFGKSVVHIRPRPTTIQLDSNHIYVYGGYRDSKVISFSTKTNFAYLLYAGGQRTTCVTVDPITKKWNSYTSEPSKDFHSEDMLPVPPSISPTMYATIPKTYKDAATEADEARSTADSCAYQAELTVIGNPNITPFSYIGVIVYKTPPIGGTPGNMTDIKSVFSYGSGVFWVSGVTHTISGGRFTSTLSLTQNSGPKGISGHLGPRSRTGINSISDDGTTYIEIEEIHRVADLKEGTTKPLFPV